MAAVATPPRRPMGATLTQRQRLVIFGAIMLCMFLTAIDQSIVSTALAHIAADLHGFKSLSWVISSYLVTSTVTIPVVGKLSDMFGRKAFMLAGIAIFVAASAACGAAPTMTVLILARAAQGVGAGLIVSCVFATLGDIFTPLERAKYFAFFTGMFTFAQLAGPGLGGLLADGPGWRWCFYINLPLGIGASIFIVTQLPRGGGAGGRIADIDFRGALLLGVSTVALLFAVVWASPAFGWTSPETLGLIAVAVVTAVAFVFNERTQIQPIIPLALFRNVPFVQGVAMTTFAAFGIFAGVQFLPTYVQTSLGASAAASGYIVTAQALGGLCTSIIGGQIIARTGRFKYQMIFGTALMATAAFILSHLEANEAEWRIGVVMVLMGFGTGCVFPVTQVLVQGAVSQEQQGVASSTRQFFNLIGQTMGVATLGLVLTTSYVTAFTADSVGFSSTMPPAVYQQFKDPTLALDPVRFEPARAALRALPNGEATLNLALQTQKRAVATAIDHVFLGTLLMALIVLGLAISVREITLRHSFDADDAAPAVDL